MKKVSWADLAIGTIFTDEFSTFMVVTYGDGTLKRVVDLTNTCILSFRDLENHFTTPARVIGRYKGVADDDSN